MAKGYKMGQSGGGINKTLPFQLTAFTAVADSTPQITLSWENPTEYWAGTLIVKKAGSAPEGVNDGEKIYNGTGTSFVDTAVEYDTEYFYRAFPYNAKKQYQTEVLTVSAVALNAIPLSELAEGALVSIMEDGVAVPFYLAKHDYESGLNGAGRQLMVRKDCYDKRAWHSSKVNAYASSTIDSWQNGTYKAKFNATVQTMIGTTKFYYTVGGGDGTLTTLERAVFLLSFTELGKSPYNSNTEGTALPIAITLQTVYYNGETISQWVRTPDKDNIGYAGYFTRLGDAMYTDCTGYPTNDVYSRPCFTLPADALVDPTPNADGSYNLIES